jgi:transcriptional regulator with XRE-family HTH domain
VSEFGETLTQLLHERGISQNQLARRLDVSSPAVSYWITGKYKPTYENVTQIEDELAVEPRGSLLEAAGYSPVDHGAPTVESLLRADPGLHPEDKRIFLRLIRMARERFAAESEQRLVEEVDSHR